jgi:hypothetical protein
MSREPGNHFAFGLAVQERQHVSGSVSLCRRPERNSGDATGLLAASIRQAVTVGTIVTVSLGAKQAHKKLG